MKITKSQLKRIIKEELQNILIERRKRKRLVDYVDTSTTALINIRGIDMCSPCSTALQAVRHIVALTHPGMFKASPRASPGAGGYFLKTIDNLSVSPTIEISFPREESIILESWSKESRHHLLCTLIYLSKVPNLNEKSFGGIRQFLQIQDLKEYPPC